MDAYRSCGGKGYTRIDIRQDASTGKLYMLEVNAQCGLSEDENYTSIRAILKASNVSFTSVVVEILYDALRRKALTSPAKRSAKSPARIAQVYDHESLRSPTRLFHHRSRL